MWLFFRSLKNNEQNSKRFGLNSEHYYDLQPPLMIKGFAVSYKGCERVSCSVVSDSSRPRELSTTRLLSPRNAPGQNQDQVAIPFSRGSSQSRDPTRVSSIAGRLFSFWATREGVYHQNQLWWGWRAADKQQPREGWRHWVKCLH